MLESEKIVYTFGKHNGESLRYVLENDSPYFAWCYYNAPQFQKMIKDLDEDFIKCIEIASKNELIRQHNKKIFHCMQQDKYLKNPYYFKYFKEPKTKLPSLYYSYEDYLYDENDNIFDHQDNDMNNDF